MARAYVRFDEREDVLASLDLLVEVVPLLRKRPPFWKWAIVGSHSALQGAMVYFLRGTSGIEVLDERSARKWHEWYETMEGMPPDERLADFDTLLWRCCRKLKNQGTAIELTRRQLSDIRRLHRHFRNNFAHFTPKGWSIEKAGLPRIMETAVSCTGRLMGDDWVTRQLSGNQKRRLIRDLKVITSALGNPI